MCWLLSTLFTSQGDEVFNTYGELANWQLIHMYGFAESPSDNHYDAVRRNRFSLVFVDLEF